MESERSGARQAGDRTRVLYLGWSNEAADALARHHCDTTFVVAAPDAEGPAKHGVAGRAVVVVPDPTRVDDVVAGLMRESIDGHDFEFVTTEHEQCIVPAAVLAEAYGQVGLPVFTAVALRDKFVQKSLVRAAGIPTARCRTVIDVADLRSTDTPRPFVVKPLAGAGTRLTYAVRDQESLDSAASGIASSGQHGPWLIEEYVRGGELHVDGVVRDGTIGFLGVGRYLQNLIGIRRGGVVGSLVVDPDTHPRLYRRARELTAGVLGALGHTDGVFHLEAFDQGDRLVFGECAGRIGGGMIWEVAGVKFGVDLYDEWARAVLGRPSGISAGRCPDGRPYGWVHLSARPGRVVSIPGPDDLRMQPGVVAAQVSVEPGDTVPDATTASSFRAARVMMTGASEDLLAEEMRTLAQWFRNQVQVAS